MIKMLTMYVSNELGHELENWPWSQCLRRKEEELTLAPMDSPAMTATWTPSLLT